MEKMSQQQQNEINKSHSSAAFLQKANFELRFGFRLLKEVNQHEKKSAEIKKDWTEVKSDIKLIFAELSKGKEMGKSEPIELTGSYDKSEYLNQANKRLTAAFKILKAIAEGEDKIKEIKDPWMRVKSRIKIIFEVLKGGK